MKAGAASETIRLGSTKAFDGSLYARIGDQKKVLLVSSAWDIILSKSFRDFRDKRLYRAPVKADITKLTVKGRKRDDSGPLDYQLSKSEKGWAIQIAQTSEAVDTSNVEAYLAQLKSLHGSDFATTAPTAPLFKGDVTIAVERTEGGPYELRVARDKSNFDLYEATSSDLQDPMRARVALAKEAAAVIWEGPEAFYNTHAPFEFDEKAVARVIFDDAKLEKHLDSKLSGQLDAKAPDVMISKIHSLAAVRFLGVQPQKKFPSSLRLLNSTGGLVFEMSWGDPVIEKANTERPEARYLPVRTNFSNQVIGVPEKQILSLSEGK